jgi:hypothetical protein
MPISYSIDDACAILIRTPAVLETMLAGLPDAWLRNNEGGETWSPFDIAGHLLHGERTDWIPRLAKVMGSDPDNHFMPFDRFAQFRESEGKTIAAVLEEFSVIRKQNLAVLRSANITQEDLDARTGIHPQFGEVTLRQLLSTWVAHDLAHIAQIARVMAKQYKDEVGPWKEYLRIMTM